MRELAGSRGFQFRALHFDTLAEIAATGAARTILPCLIGEGDARLTCTNDVVLEQPLWMLHHRQEREVRHLETARSWIRTSVRSKLVA